jgi:hypothetical protein
VATVSAFALIVEQAIFASFSQKAEGHQPPSASAIDVAAVRLDARKSARPSLKEPG